MDKWREIKVQIYLFPDGTRNMSIKAMGPDGKPFFQSMSVKPAEPVGKLVTEHLELAQQLYEARQAAAASQD